MNRRTAICRGAVYKGFLEDQLMGADEDDNWVGMKTLNIPAPIRVTSTISRYSLGTVFYDNFDPSKHSRLDPDYEWHSNEGDYVINNQTKWYIRKVVLTAQPLPRLNGFMNQLTWGFRTGG